ncbi:TonB-dependent receptor domain-containing protein [Thalassotalea eurytherma]|uniref:TonB-dependent receptor n=1 Tax=Thalassotalea eurytherma TaxID=1144278 RepID=A0ABQ6H174_9GAMM|nr:TonB-dependent receptor [Thalassotalea eurytherma]GLX81867.1 TonB-dependent receptor [Thalassotalea eurytherma]
MKKNLITLAILGSSTLFAGNALAQENEQKVAKPVIQTENKKENAKKTEEKITVTGSRLRRDSFSVATPLVTMDKDAIEDTGLGSLSEILINELPQVSMGSSNTNSQSSVSTTGLSTIDLRSLGTNRTLTLIDGRRVVSNSYSGNYVSLSTIPAGMVDKVEIITGGASAAYGSDAIAGVVNIITQHDKEGFSFKAKVGESQEGGAEEYTLDIDYGTEFSDGRGYLFMAGTYNEEKGLSFYDRKRAQQQDAWRYNDDDMCNQMLTEDSYQCMRDITQADWRSLSDSIPGGVFDEQSSTRADAGFWYDENGLRNDWHEERYGINTNQFVMLKIPDEAYTGAIKVDYELTDEIDSYFQVQYSINKSINHKAPESEDECDSVLTYEPSDGTFGTACIGRIPIDNPYMPAEIRDDASSKGVKWDRNFAEVGNIVTDNERTTLRSWAGLQGTLFNDEWDWDLSVGYGKFKQEQQRLNEINVFRAQHALNAEYAADGVTVQCADELARADGCVPLNLFGEGSITPEAADYIRANPTITTDIEQINVLGYIAGDLFQMPAGSVASAFGFEYRRDEQKVKTGGGAEIGGVSFNYVPTFTGDVDVYEVFGEAAFPLLADQTFAKSLTAEISARLASYSWSNIDLVGSYKVGLIWEPIEGYALRANWARAQRAPTITEALSPPRGDYDSFDDICDGVTATSTEPGHSNCRLEPSIAAVIAADGEFVDENSGYSPNVGNTELKEETADTYTVGLTMAPDFLEGLRVAVDFYDIQITDAISYFDNEDIIEYCYDSPLEYGDSNTFCNDITRNTEGSIEEIMQRNYNVDEIRTKGYDIAAEYVYDLEVYGSLKFKTDWMHVIEYSQTVQSPSGPETTNYEGYLSSDIFEDKASASLTWYKDGMRVRWSTGYKSAVKASRSRYESWLDDMAANDERCLQGEDTCIDAPEALEFNDIGSYLKHNLSISYTTELNKDAELRLFGGVNNMFDNRGEFIIGGKGNFDSAYGGGVGRYIYIGAEIKL